jgi:hypothetical protein
MDKQEAKRLLQWSGCFGTSLTWEGGEIRDTTGALTVDNTWPSHEGEGHLLAAAPELARWGIEQAEGAERVRAELADLRARVGAAIATIRDMEAHHRQGARSPAHGGYSFERAEAYEHAADLLEAALEPPAPG